MTIRDNEKGIEIQRVWNVKIKAISVIMGATGTIPKSFRKYKSNILEEHKSIDHSHTGHCTHTS